MADAPLHFYYNPQSRAAIVHWMLEELGVPYQTHLLRFDKGEHKSPEFLAINPMGKVPTVRHGDVVVTEGPAICCYLADVFRPPASRPRSAIPCADRICDGCSSAAPASSRRWPITH